MKISNWMALVPSHIVFIIGLLALYFTEPIEYNNAILVSEPIIFEEAEEVEEVVCDGYDIVDAENEELYINLIKEIYAEDIYNLARIIHAECGGWDLCSDKMCYYTGSVVLNRVYSDYFPDTIEKVIFQDGQYSPVCSGTFYNEPNERSVRIATDLIAYGSQLPENVLFQANFKQGDGVYEKVQNMYFCYKD